MLLRCALGARRLCTTSTKASVAAQRLKEAVVDGLIKEPPPPPQTLLGRYATQLAERPLRTNALTSGLLCALGDVLAQAVESRNHLKDAALDGARTGRMLIYGVFVCGPLLTGWYQGLNHVGQALSVSYRPVISWIPAWYREAPGTSPARLLATKVVADSLLFQAPFLTLYFGVMGLLEGKSAEQIYRKTKDSFHQAWALSLLVWTPVQCVNLFFVPVAWQPFVVSAVNVGWKSTLSLLNQHAHAAGPENAFDAALQELRAENGALREALAALQAQHDELVRRQRWWWWPAAGPRGAS